jgi:hypothetical protein
MHIYEDDGSSYNYQRGEFTRIECSWNDAERKLTFKSDANGRLPVNKLLSIEVVGTSRSKQMTLSGEMISVRL